MSKTKRTLEKNFQLGRISALVSSKGSGQNKVFSVSFKRQYIKDGKTFYTDIFFPEDLPVIGKLGQAAEEFVMAANSEVALV